MCITLSMGFQNMAAWGQKKTTVHCGRKRNEVNFVIYWDTNPETDICYKMTTFGLLHKQIKPLSGSQNSLCVTSQLYAPWLHNWPSNIVMGTSGKRAHIKLHFQSVIYICLCLSGKTWDRGAASIWWSLHLWAGSRTLYLAQENSKSFPSLPDLLQRYWIPSW